MQIIIDTSAKTLTVHDEGQSRPMDLYTPEAFQMITEQWLKVGWDQKYTYTFSWLGRPIIQLPEDLIRIQEVIYRLRPDVIVETGVAHGGSLVYYASLCRVMGQGRVVGVDIEIRPHNRRAIEVHELFPLITLVEGSSTDPAIVAEIKRLVAPGETVLVLLDSSHARAHVAAELEAYHGLVTKGSYIVATDGIMQSLADVPRGQPGWSTDHPAAAAADFAARHPEFVIATPPWPFNESPLCAPVTHWPGAWLRRVE